MCNGNCSLSARIPPSLGNITEYGELKPSANCPGAAQEEKWLLYLLLSRRRGIILDGDPASQQDSITAE